MRRCGPPRGWPLLKKKSTKKKGKRAAVLLLAAVALVSTCARPASHLPLPDQNIDHTLTGRVDERAMRRSVRELVALGPRMGGTPSGDRAAAHLERAFAAAGLAVRVERDPAKRAHWEDDWRVEWVPRGTRLGAAWPYGFSPSIDPPREGPLLAMEDPGAAGAAANGAVIYTPRGPSGPSGMYGPLARSGVRPLAILTSAPHLPDRYQDSARIGELPSRGENPVPVFAVSYREGRELAAAAGRSRIRVGLRAHAGDGSPLTVVATLAGREARYLLICAHGDSDSGGPGADDNASGVAVTLELARVFASLVREGRLAPPRLSLRFAVWGSEHHSSKAFIDREGPALTALAAVINFDQTGTGASREAIYAESNEIPWNRDLLRTIERAGVAGRGRPGFWPEFTTNPSQGGTDSYAFLPTAHKGTGDTSLEIPATTIFTAAWDAPATLRQTPGWAAPGDAPTVTIDYSRYYHSSGDTPENTTEREPQNMVRAARLAGLAILDLAW